MEISLRFSGNYENKYDENLKKMFANTYKFSNNDINKFILLLEKDVYPYNYTNRCYCNNKTNRRRKYLKVVVVLKN